MRILLFADHPIQYQVPIFRKLDELFPTELQVLFRDLQMGNGAIDPDFGRAVRWDTPILEGYQYAPTARGRVFAELRKYRPEAIVLFVGYSDSWAWEVLLCAKLLGVPVLWRFEGTDRLTYSSKLRGNLRNIILAELYRHVSGFLSVGRGCTAHLKSHGVQEERIFSAPYNVDSELFEAMYQQLRPSRTALRAKLGLAADDFAFVVVGKLIERKNPDCILRALRLLQHNPHIKVLFVGSGPLEERLQTASQAEFQGRLFFSGFANQTELAQYYVSADAAILASRYETWGLVVNEAMHFGLPVLVASNIGCHGDLVERGRTGYTFEDNDARDLAGKMDLLANQPADAAALGAAGHDLIQQYTTEAAALGIAEALRAVTRQSLH